MHISLTSQSRRVARRGCLAFKLGHTPAQGELTGTPRVRAARGVHLFMFRQLLASCKLNCWLSIVMDDYRPWLLACVCFSYCWLLAGLYVIFDVEAPAGRNSTELVAVNITLHLVDGPDVRAADARPLRGEGP